MAESPFASIDSAHEFVDLLAHEVEQVKGSLRPDIEEAASAGAARRLDALRLVDYKLQQLTTHLSASCRILNDLRTLRRLLVGDQDRPAKQTRHVDAGPRRRGAPRPH